MIIKVEELINGCVDEVWAAITKPEEMKMWYFDNIPDFKPEVDFETRFEMKSNDKTFTATWSVIEVIPKKKIKYNWSYDEYEGLGAVTFKLSPQGEKTLITVTNEGLETFPQNIPEFTRESCLAGWEFFINTSLPKYLENKANFNNKI
jgi:uncharacterized protein YndB with AHSA1/START domain